MNVRVQRLGPGDAGELFAAIRRSRTLLGDWVTPPASAEELRATLARHGDDDARYGVRAEDGGLAGVVNLTSIIRGPFQNGFLGYFALAPYDGRGYVRAGLAQVLDLAFGELGLHRVEASVQPGNDRSARLLLGWASATRGTVPATSRSPASGGTTTTTR